MADNNDNSSFDINAFTANVNANDTDTQTEDEGYSDGWVPDEALDELIEDGFQNPEKTFAQRVQAELERQAPVVAKSMVRLATHSKSESTRLNAGKYILDRVLDAQTVSGTPLEQLFTEITDYREKHDKGAA